MGYSSEVYRKAQLLLEERRRRAENELQMRKTEIYDRVPEVETLSKELSGNMITLSLAVLKGSEDALSVLRQQNEEARTKIRAVLAKNGFDPDALEPKYTCPICQDTGRVNGALCSCYKEVCRLAAGEELEQSSGAAGCSFDNFRLDVYPKMSIGHGVVPYDKMQAIFSACRSYADNFSIKSPSLLFVGRTGLGKTHLSLAIAKVVLEKDYGVVYQTSQRLVNDLEREQFSNTGSDALRKKYAKCDLLIIDDLGAEFSTSFTVAAIGNLINERLFEYRPTIISTNLATDELTKRYSERTGSRLLGEYKLLYFLGNDLRTH